MNYIKNTLDLSGNLISYQSAPGVKWGGQAYQVSLDECSKKERPMENSDWIGLILLALVLIAGAMGWLGGGNNESN